MCSGAKRKELIEVVKYYRDEFDSMRLKYVELADTVGLVLVEAGTKVMGMIRAQG